MVAAMAIQRPGNIRLRVVLAQWMADTSDSLARTLLPNVYARSGLIGVHCHAVMNHPLFQRALPAWRGRPRPADQPRTMRQHGR